MKKAAVIKAAGNVDGAAKRKTATYIEKSDSAKAHSTIAADKSDQADESGDAADHQDAAVSHQTAADKHRRASRAAPDDKKAGHESAADDHEATAKEHLRKAKALQATEAANAEVIRAADGTMTGKPAIGALLQKVQQAIQGDARWDDGKRGYTDGGPNQAYHYAPFALDILVPDDDGKMCAVIRTNSDKTVKHYFTWDGEKVVMDEGDSEPTESTLVYSKAIEEHGNALKAAAADFANVLQCHETGVPIQSKKTWVVGEPVVFQWMPGGVNVITATYGRGDSKRPIQIAIKADKDGADKIQASFEQIKANNPRRPPYGCIEHRAEERAFEPLKFEWSDEPEPAIYCTVDPSELGARNVNGKIHTSFSPTFDTDAEYGKLKCSECGGKEFPKAPRGAGQTRRA